MVRKNSKNCASRHLTATLVRSFFHETFYLLTLNTINLYGLKHLKHERKKTIVAWYYPPFWRVTKTQTIYKTTSWHWIWMDTPCHFSLNTGNVHKPAPINIKNKHNRHHFFRYLSSDGSSLKLCEQIYIFPHLSESIFKSNLANQTYHEVIKQNIDSRPIIKTNIRVSVCKTCCFYQRTSINVMNCGRV